MLSWISEKTKIKKSHIFWLGVGFLVQLLTGILLPELLGIVWVLGSILVMADAIDGMDGEDDFPWHIWFPIIWFLMLLFGFGYLMYLIFRKPVSWIGKQFTNFNEKLDR